MNNLFDKTSLRGHVLRNRVWRSATWMALADSQGYVTDEIVKAYETLAEGGVAVIVTGLTSIAREDARIGGEAKFYDDRFVAGHRRLSDAVHRQGALVMMQTAMVDGPVDELSTEQVEAVVKAFGDAAHRAELAGYDGVQIHAAHFFYLSKFISPLINHRSDRYGGSSEGRARILVEILKDMRSKTSEGFLITMKLNCTDAYPGGLTQEDFLECGRQMAAAGIDAIEVSGNGTSRAGIRAGVGEGYFLPAAARLAEEVDADVVLVGGLRSMDVINRVLNDTKVKYVSLSRPLIREPHLLQRWSAGDGEAAHCVSCNACYRTKGHCCIFA